MNARLLVLAALLSSSCGKNRLGYEGLPAEATPNARLREGTHSAILARYFTTPAAVTSRVWGSAAGVWAFNHLRFTFDDELRNVTPREPELLFMPVELAAVKQLPPPPDVTPSDFPHVQVEAGATPEDEATDAMVQQRSARFVMAADPAWLVVRHRPAGRDRLLRLAPGAMTWTEETLPAAVRDLHLREAGPEVALFELADGKPAMVRAGQLVALDSPPASLGVPAGAPSWVGPFDGTTLRLFWTTPTHQLCTGTWDLVAATGRRDGCLDFNVEGARVLRAAGTVEETIATVKDSEPLARVRSVFVVATASGLTIKGEGGYGTEDAGVFVAWSGANPVLSESECPLDPGFYGVSRHFDADGGFGFVRCPRVFLADTCTCDRTTDLKGCECLQRSVQNTRQFRAGRYTYLQAGWEDLDARLLLRVHRYESDTGISTTADPMDALTSYTGPYSWKRATPLLGLAPGYGGLSSGRVNLGRCATVTAPSGPVARNADDSFDIDLRDPHTIELDCQPPDQGPRLERLTIEAGPMLDGGGFDAWRLEGVRLVRGTPVDLPDGVITTLNPAAPEMIASALDGSQRLLRWDGGVVVEPLPSVTGTPIVVSEVRQAIFPDGTVIDLDTRAVLATLAPGQLAADRQGWFGPGGSVWALARGVAPANLGAFPQPEPPVVASPSGIVVTRSSTGVRAVDANDRSRRALIYGPTAGPIQEGAVSADGRFIALRETSVSTAGNIRFYRRDESSASLAYVETQLCTNCGQMFGFAPSTGDVLHLDAQTAGVFVYRPAMGTSLQLTSSFPETHFTRMPVDAWGRVWFKHDDTLNAWDPASQSLISTTISRSPSDPASTMAVLNVERNLFKGVTWGRRRYTVMESGLVLTFDGGPDQTRSVRPLAGGRGWRIDSLGSWVGRVSSNLLSLDEAVHMDRLGTALQGVEGPEDAFMPCRLVQSGPQPSIVVSATTNWRCQ